MKPMVRAISSGVEWLRDDSVMISSATPSQKYYRSGLPLILVKASTAIDSLTAAANVFQAERPKFLESEG
jgi:hypothetical protein